MPDNGQLTAEELARIRHPGGIKVFLRKDAAIAWEAMRRISLRGRGVDLYPLGGASAYRTVAQQQYFWDLYQSGRGNLAARPGTSNHGWGNAVDLAAPPMRSAVDALGSSYGWRKVEAPSEWWHVNYVGPYVPHARDLLTEHEYQLVHEYFVLKKANKDRPRRAAILRWLTEQRKRIWREANKSGWETANRRQRYDYLKKITPD
ncbi:MAG: hypothetical protein QOI98_400 [Solirubrobacteraceae bacterium]|nr:hypothetical protein [Solirubrobacteraceae bacterium]